MLKRGDVAQYGKPGKAKDAYGFLCVVLGFHSACINRTLGQDGHGKCKRLRVTWITGNWKWDCVHSGCLKKIGHIELDDLDAV